MRGFPGSSYALMAAMSGRMPMMFITRVIVAALETLADAARRENKPDYVAFAEKLTAHAQTEELVIYPTALLIGAYVREKLSPRYGHSLCLAAEQPRRSISPGKSCPSHAAGRRRSINLRIGIMSAFATATFAAVALFGAANATPIAPFSAVAVPQSGEVVLAHYYHGRYYPYYHHHHYYHHYRHHHW